MQKTKSAAYIFPPGCHLPLFRVLQRQYIQQDFLDLTHAVMRASDVPACVSETQLGQSAMAILRCLHESITHNVFVAAHTNSMATFFRQLALGHLFGQMVIPLHYLVAIRDALRNIYTVHSGHVPPTYDEDHLDNVLRLLHSYAEQKYQENMGEYNEVLAHLSETFVNQRLNPGFRISAVIFQDQNTVAVYGVEPDRGQT
ncbi:MAG: hypothetical protein PHN51_11950 [Candidatus Nanopelagicales bacterium]|nr:hypothetical protein [Candidatus Nanopelagicales bacterium]